MPHASPPSDLLDLIEEILVELLEENPMATSSEAFVQNYVELEIMSSEQRPPYYLRIGINYHGQMVQHITVDPLTGVLVGWNPDGDALGTGKKAKMLLAGVTIFPRDNNEPMMNDTKVGGGSLADDGYVRIEWKVRGWLGKTKNLAGKEFEKDIDLLSTGNADLLVWCLSETAHRKFRGEGPDHQVLRRTGVARFRPLLPSIEELEKTPEITRAVSYEGHQLIARTRLVEGDANSVMPGALHTITMVWHQ
jgi:hypothetical protein